MPGIARTTSSRTTGAAAAWPAPEFPDPGTHPKGPEAASAGSAATWLLAGSAASGFAGACRVTGHDGATLVVDPESGGYYFESTWLLPLAALLSLPAAAWTPVFAKSLDETRNSGTAQPLERLRWFAGLVASPGVLNPALERGARYRLDHWMAIEREFPRHFRIAKQFLDHATTVDDAAAATDVPTAAAIDYVNAGIASGRLRIVA